ncbi:expressed unknown protein [Seminavis robusta]|uniref:Uncharacterized protein n=1 Tax=Seminavis robusta TaxID=568900 RepID=A0A9N8DVY7_9STRA|nr:expressed unknown protein [Seminavis robusta]|eukprot:Sro413_g138160.1 n/a (601) ;mRNA; f:51222-53325
MSHRFPVYQIDFQAVASGKVVASSKRKVRWRFGFPNQQALSEGRTGVECRGEEHDIVLIWSVASGKRQLYMDGREVHFSTSRAQTFQYSWSAKGNHVIKVVAHATPPILGEPYELFIDGQPFSSMPKSYELGIRGQIPSHARVPGAGGYGKNYGKPGVVPGPSSRAQEEADLQKAISASLQESKQFLANKTAPPAVAPAPATGDLMDLGGPPQPATVSQPPAYPAAATNYGAHPPTYGAPPAPHYGAAPPNYGAPPPNYGAPPPNYGAPPPNYGAPAQYAAPPPVATHANPGFGSPTQSTTSMPGAMVPSTQPSNPYAVTPTAAAAYQSPTSTQGSLAPSTFSGAPYSAPSHPVAANAYAPAPPPPAAAVATGDLFAPPPVDPFAPNPQSSGGYFVPGQPVPPLDDPFAPRPPPPPTRDDITNSILSAYAAPTTPTAPGGVPQAGPPQPGQPMPPVHPNAARIGYGGHMPPQEEKPQSEMEKALKKLVNVDRIDEPAEQEYQLTMKVKEEERKTKDGKSRGRPPAATGLVGSNATLDHIKHVKPEVAKTGDGVMKAPPQLFHPDAVHAGALVVHGQGPPPIQRGFGVGYGGAPPSNFRGW